jgi:sirohydrochlorin ferrochelatase
MKTILVLAMHGAPPNDFPKNELAELMNLHNRMEHSNGADRGVDQKRYLEIKAKVCNWPRTAANDPFYAGSTELARQLESISGIPVVLGFNEYCAPTLDEALEQSISQAEQVFVITPMMTRGGEHSEQDIPNAIYRAQQFHPDANIKYIWPFEVSSVARFLTEQIQRFR